MEYEQRIVLFQKAKIKEASGDMAGADQLYVSLIKGEGLGPSSTKEEYVLLYQAYYRRLSINLSNKHLAMQLASEIVEFFHKEKDLEEAYLFDIARFYLRLEEPMSAYDLLRRLLREYPKTAKKEEASLELAKIYHEVLGQPEKAIPFYTNYLQKTTANNRLVASLLSDCYLSIGDIQAAELTLSKYTEIQAKKNGR